jgi:oligoribonuclease NrnB/cAMP/cGMP phosphodiesterase (DHH superfamily)
MEKIVSKFLSIQKIPVSPSYVEKIISSHSDYPSLLSIADSLERLGVEYQAWKVTRDELNSIAFPYLLPISVGGGDILLIQNSSDLKKNEEKLNYWEGTILKTEHTSLLIDKENNGQYTQESFYKVLTVILNLCFLELSHLVIQCRLVKEQMSS